MPRFVRIERVMSSVLTVYILCCCAGCQLFGFRKPEGWTSSAETTLLEQPIVAGHRLKLDGDSKNLSANEQKNSLMFAKARLLEVDGKQSEALQAYETLLKREPGHVFALHRAAVLQSQLGQFDQAEEKFRSALASEECPAQAYADYGYFCYLRNRSDEAESLLKEALQRDSGITEASTNLGMIHARRGEYDEARVHFLRAGCDNSEVCSNIAFARLLERDLTSARNYYGQSLQFDPSHAEAQEGLALADKLLRQSDRIVDESGSANIQLSAADAPGRATLNP